MIAKCTYMNAMTFHLFFNNHALNFIRNSYISIYNISITLNLCPNCHPKPKKVT